MKGYDVVTVDDEKIGRVVDDRGGSFIVERGLLRSRHAIPHKLAEVDEAARKVVVAVSKEMVRRSPHVSGDEAELAGTAAYYGLAEADPAPTTLGRGTLAPDDPALTAAEEATRAGVEPAEERRARQRKETGALAKGPLDAPPGGWDSGAAADPRQTGDDR